MCIIIMYTTYRYAFIAKVLFKKNAVASVDFRLSFQILNGVDEMCVYGDMN